MLPRPGEKCKCNLYKLQKESPNPKVILEIGLVSVADSFDSVQESAPRPIPVQRPEFTRPEFTKPAFVNPPEAKKEIPVVQMPVETPPPPIEEAPPAPIEAPTPATEVKKGGADVIADWHDIVTEVRRNNTMVELQFPLLILMKITDFLKLFSEKIKSHLKIW